MTRGDSDSCAQAAAVKQTSVAANADVHRKENGNITSSLLMRVL
jgi:hypothetical protein